MSTTELEAIADAYGYLWCVNTELGTPGQYYPPEEAAYAARKLLLGLLTDEQRRAGIQRARDGVAAAIADPYKFDEGTHS